MLTINEIDEIIDANPNASKRDFAQFIERAALAKASQDNSCGCSNCEDGHPCEFSKASQQVQGEPLKSLLENLKARKDLAAKNYLDAREQFNTNYSFYDGVMKSIEQTICYVQAMPAPKQEPVMYQAACSGLWYKKPDSCGDIIAVKVGDTVVNLPPQAASIPEIAKCAQDILDNDGADGSKCFNAFALGHARTKMRALLSAAPKPEGE